MNKKLFQFPPISKKQYWGELHGCSLPLALAEYCTELNGIQLIIAPDNLMAGQLFEEIRFFLNPKSAIELLLFPDWETLPYDQFSPHQDIISERLYTLNRITQLSKGIIICSITTLMHRLCPPDFLHHNALLLKEKQALTIEPFREQLQQAGYRCVSQVFERGEFGIRGSIFDIFPMGSEVPFRIELFDNEIESLRAFDPDSQRTIHKLEQIALLPAREFPLTPESISHFRRSFREQFAVNPSQCPIYEAVSDGQFPAGIEYYLPLFFKETATLFSYLPPHTNIAFIGDILIQAEKFWQEVNTRYEQRNSDILRPILKPEHCFLAANEVFMLANHFNQLRCSTTASKKKGDFYDFPVKAAPDLPLLRKDTNPLKNTLHYLHQNNFQRFLFVVESAGRRETFAELLTQTGIQYTPYLNWQDFINQEEKVGLLIGPLTSGAELIEASISIIVEAQLFGEQAVNQRKSGKKAIDPDLIIRDLVELRVGSPVVHIQFGVGRFQGLQVLESQGVSNEFLVLSYAGNDKIYVPVTSLNLISRYTGLDSEHAPLHKLGSDQWQKEKKKTAEKIYDVAVELLEIYAQREARPGFSYEYGQQEYQIFASSFAFTETEDQLKSINEVISDMKSSRPMDRLICGDVGFGKTEVAMRAAFIAVQNNKQVCILVPTTLLANQHFETFRDRFANFPINIALLSRFRSAKEMAKSIEDLKNGKIDIVIGTHKLFSKDIAFKNLGLLIIDEEHRFGVKQKEHIKALRTNVDILSMTATPIPRTLNMAMHGIRDISLIATPPAKRLAIKTFWQEKSTSLIREAILREILRGGQVYYLYNNVQSIERIALDIQTYVPEAKVQVAHGQMRERDLERIMSDFYHHRFNVLVCTTIIETGIDIPTANTIIIDRADKFGLAQLHQLRGRVGRSHHQAYAYLMTPNKKLLTADALKRLEAIVSLEDLGAGFTLATHDLEIRGAGELLGEDQSGNMQAVGFNLYMEMLDRAVSDLKSGKTPELTLPLHTGAEIDLGMSTVIPEDYVPDTPTRLILYKRIANAQSPEALSELQIEFIDRFGFLPQPTKQLFLMRELKGIAQDLGIQKIILNQQQGKIEFGENPHINAERLIELIQKENKRYRLEGPSRLCFTLNHSSNEERIVELKNLLISFRLP